MAGEKSSLRNRFEQHKREPGEVLRKRGAMVKMSLARAGNLSGSPPAA